MFIGTYYVNLDKKGRLNIPAKFREILNSKYSNRLILINFDNCIVAYPTEEWLILEEKTKSLPTMKKDVRTFMRLLYSGAAECSTDKQGRILIPSYLRESISLDAEAVIIGILNKMEIWSKNMWDSFFEESKEKFEDIAEGLSELGF
ncbi:MAG TPA: division/cell wall cluster transcriptional repressor MraZ [Nitrospinota bacterium]|nr:division/cell wall cluster transcriptional repressor MraZ [Nitrospinota bacterium]